MRRVYTFKHRLQLSTFECDHVSLVIPTLHTFAVIKRQNIQFSRSVVSYQENYESMPDGGCGWMPKALLMMSIEEILARGKQCSSSGQRILLERIEDEYRRGSRGKQCSSSGQRILSERKSGSDSIDNLPILRYFTTRTRSNTRSANDDNHEMPSTLCGVETAMW